jgi:hypothetical protein
MRLSVLERILCVERFRRQASPAGGFSVPVMLQWPVGPDSEPFLVSSSRGQFLKGCRSENGSARLAFFLEEEEDDAFERLLKDLRSISVEHSWGNRCNSIREAQAFMVGQGLEPRMLVVPYSMLREVGVDVGQEEAENLMLAQGCIAEVEGLRVITSTVLSPGSAVLSAAPALVGTCVRVDDRLGLLIRQANRSIALVGNVLGE